MNYRKSFVLLAMLFIGIHVVGAMSVGELADSYNYDYSDGSMKIVQFNDTMIDLNSDGLNDTLVINLTTNVSASTSYFFVVKLFEGDHLVQNFTNATVSSSTQSVSVTFSTNQLQLGQYNYSVDVRDQNYILVYSKYRTQTSLYSNFSKGTAIAAIADQRINNSLRINVSLNVTQNSTSNITVYLVYNTNRTLSSTVQANLTTPYTTISIDFDNETIKSTHYNGSYSITAVQIDNKILSSNFTTANYSFIDFAQTSFLNNITSNTIDIDANNLSDVIQFNFIISVKNTDNYTVITSLYDPNNNFIATLNTTQQLTIGDQLVSVNITGSLIYKTYSSGQFVLPVIILQQNNVTIDVVYDPYYTTAYSYADFERPPLADLIPSVQSSYANNSATVYVNITNQGLVPAFNFATDIFDNGTYQNESIISVLQPNQSVLFTYVVQNISSANFFTVIVDFNNVVDESNETNNIVSTYQPLTPTTSFVIQNFSDLTPTSLNKVLEFIMLNNGTTDINLSWTVATGEGDISSIANTLLTAGEQSSILVNYNYTTKGLITVTANIYSGGNFSTQTIVLDTRTLRILNATQSGNNIKIIEFTVQTVGSNTTIGWSIDTGESNITGTMPTNITKGENVTYLMQYPYATVGTFQVNITINSSTDQTSTQLTVPVLELVISNFVKLSSNNTKAIFNFDVQDVFSVNKTAAWSFDTNDSNIIQATQNITVVSSEIVSIIVENNFTVTGNRTVVATVNTAFANYSSYLNTTI